jgi:hypothetical protein
VKPVDQAIGDPSRHQVLFRIATRQDYQVRRVFLVPYHHFPGREAMFHALQEEIAEINEVPFVSGFEFV